MTPYVRTLQTRAIQRDQHACKMMVVSRQGRKGSACCGCLLCKHELVMRVRVDPRVFVASREFMRNEQAYENEDKLFSVIRSTAAGAVEQTLCKRERASTLLELAVQFARFQAFGRLHQTRCSHDCCICGTCHAYVCTLRNAGVQYKPNCRGAPTNFQLELAAHGPMPPLLDRAGALLCLGYKR